MLGSGAVKKWWKVNFPHLPAATEQVLPNTNFQEEKPGKIIVFKLWKLMKLKKLARHARLGKLKDNSLAHASEGCRLLTFNS